MTAPRAAMVLAAGLGTRMRPLTDDRPKALVEVAGKPLIDHTLDRLVEAGVERAVVNVHHFADLMEGHLARRDNLEIIISDERESLLDSGGGIAKAMPHLGLEPFFVANTDNVWIESGTPPLKSLTDCWDGGRMDIAILVAPRPVCYGYTRPEGFERDTEGRLTHSNSPDPLPPYNNIGIQLMKPEVIAGRTGAFSIVPVWKDLSAAGRLFGAVTEAEIIHVSDPAGRDYAEGRLGQ